MVGELKEFYKYCTIGCSDVLQCSNYMACLSGKAVDHCPKSGFASVSTIKYESSADILNDYISKLLTL